MSAMVNAKKKALSELIKKMRKMEAGGSKKPEEEEISLEGVQDKAKPLSGSEKKAPSKALGMDDPEEADEIDDGKKARASFLRGAPKTGKKGGFSKNIMASNSSSGSGRKVGRPSRKV